MKMRFWLLLAGVLVLAGCSRSDEKPAGPRAGPAADASSAAAFSASVPAELGALPVEPGAKCSVDSVNGQESTTGWTVARGGDVTIGGWLLSADAQATSNWAVVRLDSVDGASHYYVATTARGERPDLTQVFGSTPAVRKATFTAVATTGNVAPGAYRIVLLHKPDATAQSCSVGKTLTIAP
jgi:hypothetical protein